MAVGRAGGHLLYCSHSVMSSTCSCFITAQIATLLVHSLSSGPCLAGSGGRCSSQLVVKGLEFTSRRSWLVRVVPRLDAKPVSRI
jgi:hypothetical protein